MGIFLGQAVLTMLVRKESRFLPVTAAPSEPGRPAGKQMLSLDYQISPKKPEPESTDQVNLRGSKGDPGSKSASALAVGDVQMTIPVEVVQSFILFLVALDVLSRTHFPGDASCPATLNVPIKKPSSLQ